MEDSITAAGNLFDGMVMRNMSEVLSPALAFLISGFIGTTTLRNPVRYNSGMDTSTTSLNPSAFQTVTELWENTSGTDKYLADILPL